MKPVKKILALILAGVMALALLTGCGKAASPDRAAAEGVADWMKHLCHAYQNPNEISVSYQVPELRRDIVPLFDTNWMKRDTNAEPTDPDYPDENATINGTTTTVEQALKQCLRNYKDASCTAFLATDVTGSAGLASPEVYWLTMESHGIAVYGDASEAYTNATHLRIAAAHKTIGEQTFLLAVVIFEK